jgi:hypothetical protein
MEPTSQPSEQYIVTRSLLASNVELLLDNLSKRREGSKIASDDLFGSSEPSETASTTLQLVTTNPPKSRLQVLLEEKESLGLYLSGNPLDDYRELLNELRTTIRRDDLHLVVINKIRKIFTKKNLMMFALSLVTPTDDVEGIIFPKRAMEFSPILQEKELFWIKGKLSGETKGTTQKELDNGEMREYDELPKILIDAIAPFTDGVGGLYEKDDKFPLSQGKKDILASLDWKHLRTHPRLDTFEQHPATPSSLESANTQQLPQLIKLPKSLGTETLKAFKSALKKEAFPGSLPIELEIESPDGWKKAKGLFWVDRPSLQHLLTKIQG